jgi:hypothetical protein
MVARMHLLLKADGNQGTYRWHRPRGLGLAWRVTCLRVRSRLFGMSFRPSSRTSTPADPKARLWPL